MCSSDLGDELRIRRLALDVRNRVAEKLLQRLQIAAIPGDLDRMAYRTLNARGRGVELARDLGVEHLGHGIDDVHIVDGQHDRLAQVLVALDVRRDADLMDDIGDDALERGRGFGCVQLRAQAAGAAARTCGLPDAVHEQRRVDRLLHEVHRAEIGTLHEHLVIVDRR